MKNKYLPLLILLLLYSCNLSENKEKFTSEQRDSTTAQLDTLTTQKIISNQSNNVHLIALDTLSGREFTDIDSTISTKTPRITPLPFPPKEKLRSAIYMDLIGKDLLGGIPKYTPTYKLPPIEKVDFCVIDSSHESKLCAGIFPIDSLLRLNKYKYRLPDYGIFEVYYMCNDTRLQDFPAAFERYCKPYYEYYGHLILYNKNTKDAKVLTIFYSGYMDAYNERAFFIDKNYTIYLTDKMVSEGDNQADEPYITGKYEISLKKEGSISVKRLKIHND